MPFTSLTHKLVKILMQISSLFHKDIIPPFPVLLIAKLRKYTEWCAGSLEGFAYWK